jgi:hypothetical protein
MFNSPRVLTLALAMCLLSLAALADITQGIREGDTIPTCAAADAESGHAYKPGCVEKIRRAGAESEMRYNSLGLRDKDYSPKPEKGWKRLLIAGTSRMAGPGIAEKETPPRRLESVLRKSNKKIEVINAGVEGYMPLNQATRLRRWIKAYSPTHVLVQTEFASALSADLMNAPYMKVSDATLTLDRRVLGKMKPLAFLLRLDASNPADLRKILTWQSTLFRAYKILRCKLFHRDPQALTACLMGPTLTALEMMNRDATDAGASFLVLFSPGTFASDLVLSPAYDPDVAKFVDRFTPRVTLSANILMKILKKRDIPAQFGPPIVNPSMTLTGDFHLNAAGADAFARGLSLKLDDFLAE